MIHRRSWPSLEAVALATLDWVDWLNRKRLLGSIGDIPPAGAKSHCHQQIGKIATTA